MAYIFQRATGRRLTSGAGRNEDSTYCPPANVDRPLYHRRVSEPRDQQVAIAASRPRSRTMTSATSFYAASNSDCSTTPSRSESPHLTRDKPIVALERKENAARLLLSKGSKLLLRHGSKFSLSSHYNLEIDSSDRHLGRPLTSQITAGAKDHPHSVEAIRREELKRTISEPFDFQHVTHTDRCFLDSMQRVSKTELVGEFSALRAGQASKPQLRGIRAEALPVKKEHHSPPTSPGIRSETEIESSLPQTPPRPTPPPKDSVTPWSPAQYAGASRSLGNFSRSNSSSTISPVTPPLRYSSRWALPTLPSPMRPLGAYTHNPSFSMDVNTADSSENLCENCSGAEPVCKKPLPGLPSFYEDTMEDANAEHMRAAPLERIRLELADVLDEDEFKRQSVIALQTETKVMPIADDTTRKFALGHNTSETTFVHDDTTTSPVNGDFVLDDWDGAIDFSWDQAVEPEADAQSPSSMTDQVASFVDRAMTRLAGPDHTTTAKNEQEEQVLTQSPRSQPDNVESKTDEGENQPELQFQEDPNRAATQETRNELCVPDRSDASPLHALDIEAQQSWQEVLESCATPKPAVRSLAPDVSDRASTLTTSFNSDCSAASGISKSSSQESIIWSIASSIIGTQRSSNSSSSILEHLPEYPRAVKSIDDFKEALESVQEHLQEIHEEQTTEPSPHPSYAPGKQHHGRAKSLATDFVFGNGLRRIRSNSNSPRDSHCHERVPSGSGIPIPIRKSSVRDQPELSRLPPRRMRSATTVARSRHASRASYSLFPGATPTGI